MKRKLVILSIVTFAVMGGGVATKTAQAETNKSSKVQQIQIQKVRYYHALGYYRAIWNQAARTVYNPNSVVRQKWINAIHYLKIVQINSLNEIHRLTAPPSLVPVGYPPHHSLWVCIGSFEGGATSVNPNGHYGLLQMSYDWLGYIKGRASDYSQAAQEWAAENAWKANGYSYSFLYGQWFAYDNADGCYRA